ncbi:MAG: lactate racemase domain-containing protein [Lawsonibacter sp.]
MQSVSPHHAATASGENPRLPGAPHWYSASVATGQGEKRVCIVFDDITRGTPTRTMAQAVLEILLENGVAKE